MPIIGLTDRRRIPRLGKIHLGVKKMSQNGKEYPSAVDYFVCPPEVTAAIGEEKPKQLHIYFPTDDIDQATSTYYRAYSQSRGLTCKGDGLTARRLIDVSTSTTEDNGHPTGDIAGGKAENVEWIDGITCPGEECPYQQKKMCKPLMMLQFIIKDVPGLGVYKLDTSSFHSIMDVTNALALLQATRGSFRNIELILSLEAKEVSPDGRLKTVHTLHLTSAANLNELREIEFAPMLLPPEEDESEVNDLLYPKDGFAPQDVDTSTGEIAQALRPQQAAQQSQTPASAESNPLPRKWSNDRWKDFIAAIKPHTREDIASIVGDDSQSGLMRIVLDNSLDGPEALADWCRARWAWNELESNTGGGDDQEDGEKPWNDV